MPHVRAYNALTSAILLLKPSLWLQYIHFRCAEMKNKGIFGVPHEAQYSQATYFAGQVSPGCTGGGYHEWHGWALLCAIWPGHWGSCPAIDAVVATEVYLKILKTAPPVMSSSIIPSYCTVKYVTALSINFAGLGATLASVVGTRVIGKALNILPGLVCSPGFHVSLSLPEHSSDGHSRPIIRSACKTLWEHKISLFSLHKPACPSITNS